jgi:predicted ester cyclase
MSDLESFAEEWDAAFNAHDADRMRAQWADDGVFEAPGGVRLEGGDAAVAYAMGWLSAFPDGRSVLETRIIQDPWFVNLFRFEGTHKAPLQGPEGEIPATGRKLVGHATEAVRVENGKAVEARIYFDQIELLTQLGLMPEPAAASTS